MVLGMSFRELTSHLVYHATNSITSPSVRNAYMLVNFGDFIDGKTNKVADPYIQLFPITDDLAEAHSDFVKVRLGGNDTTTGQSFLDDFVPSGPPDVRTSDNNDHFPSWLDKHKTILIAVGASLGGVLLLLIAGLCFCRWRTNVREKDGKRLRFIQGVLAGDKGGYRQVHESVPSEDGHLPAYRKV